MFQKFYIILLTLLTLVLAGVGDLVAAPSTQASYVSFSNVGTTQMRITWINGNGGNRIVTITPAVNAGEAPTDGISYSANADYSLASAITTNSKVVYNGSGRTRTVLVTGLSASTSYTVKVYEYNFPGGVIDYNIDDANENPRDIKTGIAAPSAISFASIGSYSANALWTSGNASDEFIVSLWDLTTDEIHPYYDETSIGDPTTGTAETYTLQDLDLNGSSHTFGIKIKAKNGSDYSAWYPDVFTSATFQTIADATPPTYLYSIFDDNTLSTASSRTLTPGTYYVKVESSELLSANPSISFTADANGGSGSSLDVSASTLTWTVDSQTWVYSLTIPSATYDNNYSVNDETTTFTVTGTDYANNSGTVTDIKGGLGFTSYYIDNKPPFDLAVSVPSGTFGIGDKVTATITLGGAEATATYGSMTFNGVDVANIANFANLGAGSYSVSYTVADGNADTELTTNWTSLSFSMVDQNDNSSTYVTTATIAGSGTLTVDANKPVITSITLPSGSFSVDQTVSVTITATGSGNYATLTTGNFNGQALSSFTYVGGGYKSNETSTYTATYTVVENDSDILAGASLTFDLAFTDQAGNLGEVYDETEITPTNASNFNVDANSPVVTAIYLPSSTFGIGDVVTATFTTAEDDLANSAYLYNYIRINNVIVDGPSIFRIGSSNSYTASYTVVEGNTDQINVATNATTSMSFSIIDTFGNVSNTLSTPENTGNITIDGTRPVITAAWLPVSGAGEYGIGSTFNIEVAYTETDDVTGGSATFNTANLTSTSTQNSGTYNILYTVVDGHPNIFNAASVPGTFTLTDRSGNMSTIATINANVENSGTISIVGTRPTVTAVYFDAGTFTVGEVVSSTFTVASSGATDLTDFSTSFSLNGFDLELDNTENIGSGSYTASFTLTDRTGFDVNGINALTFTIKTEDPYGNQSLVYNDVATGGNTIAPTLLTGDASGLFVINSSIPTISSVSIPTGNYKVGDKISATITTDSDIFGNYSLTAASASINNVQITDFTNLSATTYAVTYTVIEGNTDRATLASIPAWFRVQDLHSNTSETFTSALTSSGAVTIDANTPTIVSVTIDGSDVGEYGIGEQATVRIESGETTANGNFNAPLESATITINGVNVTGFTRLAPTSPTYTAIYTIAEGNADRASVGTIPVSAKIKDPNGNISTEYITAAGVSPGTGSAVQIDATKPVITAVYLPSGTFNIDSNDDITVTFTVANSGTLADDNYSNSAHTFTINGYTVSTFANAGSRSYTGVWNVVEGQTDHNGTGSLTYNISTSDTFGNASIVYNQTSVTPTIVGGNGDFIVDAHRPSIASATVSDGLHGIGIAPAIQFTMTDVADYDGVTLVNASSSFNSTTFSSALSDQGSYYQIQHTIVEGNNEVATVGALSASITVMDKNGNSSLPTNPFWSPNTVFNVANSGTFRIDPTRPTITSVNVPAGDYGIGSTITATVVTTDNFNDLLSANSISFNNTSIPTTRWERVGSSSSYTMYYVVAEGDNNAYSTASQATTTFSISDESYNNNTTTTYSITSPGNVAIDASSASISAIAFAPGTYKVGDEVSFTFTADYSNYLDDAHIFTINTIEIDSTEFDNIGSNSYTGTYTISEDDGDVANIGALTFLIQTSDTFGNESDIYDEVDITATSAGAFSIDSDSPVIATATVESGNFKIGDEISMTFSFTLNDTDEGNTMALVPASSSFNGKPIENFTKNGVETYTATYTVIAGDTDVANIGALSASLTIMDVAGNVSNAFNHPSSWVVDGGGVFSIDANSPVITAVYVDGGLFSAGETITATITTTPEEAGLDLYGASSSFNGHGVTNFTENSNSYTVQYTVAENDAFVSTLADLTNKATFTLIDDNLNISNAYAGAITLGNGSTFSIDAVKPTITAALAPNGTFKIGDLVSTTFNVDKSYITAASGSINNETFTNATFVSGNYFTATYTVVEGDVDRSNANQLPYTSTITDAYGNISNSQSNVFEVNPSFIVDANRPYVDAITFLDGKYGIGEILTATFTARTKANDGTIDGTQPLESGLTLTSALINGIDVSASFADIGSGSYTLSYTVTENDADRASVGLIPVEIVVSDVAGNASNNNSNNPRSINSTGSTSIDAHKPVINNIYVEASSGQNGLNTFIIGDAVTIKLVTDTDSFGGVPYSSHTITANGENIGGTLSHNSGTYTFTYTVTEGNTDRTTLAATPMTFTLVDDHGNISAVSTQSTATLEGGADFKIDANRPTYEVNYYNGINNYTINQVAVYPNTAKANESFTVKITSNELVRSNASTPSGNAYIVIDAQGTNNDLASSILTLRGQSTSTTTFTTNRTIVDDLATDGTVASIVTVTLTDLAGNVSTLVAPTNASSRSFNIDATKPSFSFTYFTDAGLTTPIPAHGRIDAGIYYIKLEANETVKPAATFTIDNTEDNAFDVSKEYVGFENTTTFSYSRTITDATTVAGLTNENYYITSEDVIGNILTSGTFTNKDTYKVYVDTKKPQAEVNITFENNTNIITRDKNSATVTVAYDEEVQTNVNPSITFTSDPDIIADNAGSWSMDSKTFTREYSHNLTEEIKNNISATVSDASGVEDIAGNTDLGDASSTFTVNTETAIASASITLQTFNSENVVNANNRDVKVIVWYDRDMDTGTEPSITFTNNSNFAETGTASWSGSRTWSTTFTQSGEEYFAHESATVSGTDVNGARDQVGNLARGVESSTFRIDTYLPTATIAAPTSTNMSSNTIGNSSTTFNYVINYADNNGLYSVDLSASDVTINVESGTPAGYSKSVANNGTNSSTVSIWGATGDGALSINIGANIVTDLSGNENIAVATTSNTIIIDNTAPTISSYEFEYDIVNSTRSNTLTINSTDLHTLTNNAASSSFTFALTGATGGNVNSASTGSISQTNVEFSGLASDGSASITVAQGIFTDIAGNQSASFTTTGIEVDNTAPTLVAPLTITNIDNTSMWFTSSEGLYSNNDATGAISEINGTDFDFSVVGGTASLSSVQLINLDLGNSLSFNNTIDYDYVGYATGNLGLTKYTIEFWFKQVNSAVEFLVAKETESFEVHTNANQSIRFIPTTQVFIDTDPGVYNLNEWTHYASIYDPSTSTAKIYINGKLVETTNNGPNPLTTAVQSLNNEFSLGLRSGGTMQFNGSLDEVRIWNNARTSDEIQENYNKALVGNEPGLKFYANLNDINDLDDNSSNSFVGTKNSAGVTGSTSVNIPGSTTFTFNATWTGEFNGSEAITIGANDNTSLFDKAGNALLSSSTVGRNALVRPTVTFVAPTPTYVNSTGTATFTANLTNVGTNNLDATDFSAIHSGTGGGTIAYLGTSSNTATFTVAGLTGNGSASISVVADAILSPEGYGNLSRTTTTPINVDNINPVASLGNPSKTYTNSAGTFTVLVNYSDEYSGLNSVTLTNNDLTFDVINGTITSKSFSVTNNGTNSSTITLWALEGSGDIAVKVGAGVVTDNATNSNTATAFSSYVTVDNTPPSTTVTITNNSIVRNMANDGKSMLISATFNEPIDIANNVELDITVPGAGDIANAVMTRVSATSYTYTWVVANSGDGAVTFAFDGGTDLANNAISAGTLTIDPFTVDNTAPTLNSWAFTNEFNTSGTISFNEGVYTNTSNGYGTGAIGWVSDFDNPNRNPDVGPASFIAVTLLNHTAGNPSMTFTSLVTGTSDGTERYVLNGKANAIYDAVGNLYMNSSTASATMNKQTTVDDISILNADATYGIGSSVTFNLEFDRIITDAESATITLNNGAKATYLSGEGSKTISMVYVVSESDNSQLDLSHAASSSITPSNNLKDDRNFTVNQTLPATTVITSVQQVNVDTQKPVVTIAAPNMTLGNQTATFTYVVTHSDNLNVNSVNLIPASISYDGITAGNSSVNTSGTTSTITLWNVTGDGYMAIKVAAGVTADDAGNTNNETAFSNTITIDNTAPVVTFTSANPSVVNNTGTATFTYTVAGADANTGNNASSFTITAPGAGTVSTANVTGQASGTVTVTGLTGDGIANVNILAGVFTDNAGNASTMTSSATISVDNTAPIISGVTIFSNNSNMSQAKLGDNVSVTFTSTEDLFNTSSTVAGLSGLNVNSLGSGKYSTTFTVNGANTEGSATFNISVNDLAGNTATFNSVNDASSVNIDNTQPTGTITVVNATPINLTNNSLTITVTYDEDMQTSPVPNISIGAGATYTQTNATWTTSKIYTAQYDVTGDVEVSNIAVTLASETATDLAGNTEDAEVQFNYTFDVDRVGPIVTFNTANPSLINDDGTATFTYTVTGATANTGNNTTSFTVTNTGGTGNVVSANVTGNTSGTVTVTGLTGDGNAKVNILAGVFTDVAGNGSTMTSSATISVDNTAPLFSNVAISSNNADNTKAKVGDVVSLTFSTNEPINTVASATAIAGRIAQTVNDLGSNQYSTTISVLGSDTEGNVTFNIGIEDLAGNSSSTNTADFGAVTIDYTAPTSTVTVVNATPINLTSNSLTITVTYDEDMKSTPVPNISIGAGATYTPTSATWTTSKIYTALYDVTGNVEVNDIAVTLGSTSAIDFAGNVEGASTTFNNTFDVDRIAPVVTYNTANPSVVNSTGTATFTYTVIGATANTGNNTANYSVTNTGGTGTVSSANVTGNASGTVTVTSLTGNGNAKVNILAGIFTDAAGNGNISAESATISVDNMAPTVTITSNVSGTTTNQEISATLTFNESVTGIAVNDVLQTSNASASVTSVINAGTTYEITINATLPGTVNVWLAANDAMDAAGNGNTSSNTFTYSYNAVSSYSQVVLTDVGTSTTVSMGSTNKAFTMEINDDKGQGTDGNGDDLPTVFNQITVVKSGSYNFDDLISSATFFNSSNANIGTATVNANNLVFNVTSQTITDGGSGTYYMNYTLNNSSTFDIDNTSLTFTLTGSTGIGAEVGSTPFENVVKSTGDFVANKVQINATKLAFIDQPENHTLDNGATFTVKATDANNNLDKDYVGEITIVSTSPGSKTTQDSTENAVSGLASFSAYKFANWAANTTVSATATGLTSATSTAFSIRGNAPDAATDIEIIKINYYLTKIRWKASKTNSVDNNALVIVRYDHSNSSYGLNDESNLNSTTFGSNSTYSSAPSINDQNSGTGKIVLLGQGGVDGDYRFVNVTFGSTTNKKFIAAAVYMFSGNANDVNTQSYNTTQVSTAVKITKDIFDFDNENTKTSENNLFSVGIVSPNPVVDEFSMNMTLNESMDVTVDLFSTSGQFVGTMYKSSGLEAGSHILFMSMNNFEVSSGTYMLQVKAGDEIMLVPFVYKR